MIRTYYLETEIDTVTGLQTVKGIQYIHDAILGVEGTLRKLIQDTTDTEHAGLETVAVSWREATAEEKTALTTLPISIPVLDSPDVITLKQYLVDPHSGLPDLEMAFQALARLYLGK